MKIKFEAKRVITYQFYVIGETRTGIEKRIRALLAEEKNGESRDLFDLMNDGQQVSDGIISAKHILE